MLLSSRFTLLFIQFLRQPTCTSSQVPLHLQGLIRGSCSLDYSHRQILQDPTKASLPTLWMSLLS
jgi:hypothetical protein